MKLAWLTILLLTGISAAYGYAEVKKDQEKRRRISLMDAFRDMALKVKKTFSPAKAEPIKSVNVDRNYDVRVCSIITASRIDKLLGGTLRGKGQKFIEEAHKNNICPIFFASVAIHESAGGNSKMAKEKNNCFGIYKNGRYHTFDSIDQCIEFTAKLFASKLYAGGKNWTVGGIQKVYCPVSASNDPRGLNKYWLDGVLGYMTKIWGKTIYVRA